MPATTETAGGERRDNNGHLVAKTQWGVQYAALISPLILTFFSPVDVSFGQFIRCFPAWPRCQGCFQVACGAQNDRYQASVSLITTFSSRIAKSWHWYSGVRKNNMERHLFSAAVERESAVSVFYQCQAIYQAGNQKKYNLHFVHSPGWLTIRRGVIGRPGRPWILASYYRPLCK